MTEEAINETVYPRVKVGNINSVKKIIDCDGRSGLYERVHVTDPPHPQRR